MENIFNLISQIPSIVNAVTNYDYSGVIFWWKMLALFLSTLFIYGIVYSIYNTEQIFKTIRARIKPQNVPEDKNKNLEEWQKILSKGASQDENERKFAIIAADTLIEKILALAGYSGENLGERLKKIEHSDLDSLNNLWEAHKVRNRIAHEADYKLSKEDAEAALANFESALKELEYI